MSGEIIEKPKLLYTIEEAAELLGLPVSKVRRLRKAGDLTGRKIGKYLRFSVLELRRFSERTTA